MLDNHFAFHQHNNPQLLEINQPEDPFYYYFDLDLRDYGKNMQFQHFHLFYEIFILLDDAAAHIIEGQYYELQMYDIVCLRPCLLHKTYYPVGDAKKRLVIRFALDFENTALAPEYRELLSIFDEQVPVYRFSAETQKHLLTKVAAILKEGTGKTPLAHLVTHHQFVNFLLGLFQEKNRNLYTKESGQGSMANKVYDVCAYIHAHYREPLSLEGLSKRFYTSACYLSHQFPTVTGFNLTEYIQRTRVRNAQQCLMVGSQRITDIAAQCGFSSFSQFNRVFRKICGIAPSKYRKQNSQAQE